MPANTKLNLSQVSQFSSATVMFDGRSTFGKVPLNKVSIVDMKVPDDSFLTGGTLNVKNAAWGDFCDLQVVDTDLVLTGRMSPYGVNWDQLPGYPMIRQFVTSYYLKDDQIEQGSWDMPYGAKVYAGMYMRLLYHSQAMMGMQPEVAMNYHLHKIIVMGD